MKKPNLRQKQIYETLSNSPLFWSEIKKVKNRLKIGKNGAKKEKALSLETKKIVKKLHLPSEWNGSIKRCLETGKLNIPSSPNCQIVFNANYETGEVELFLKIFKKTILKDIKNNWKNIKKFQKVLPEIKAKELSEQELQIYQWKKEGKSSSWIVSVNGGGITWLTPNAVSQIYSRVKRLIG